MNKGGRMTAVVYVKHYVTHSGMDFICKDWFLRVRSALQEQDGFLSFIHSIDRDDPSCCLFELQFKNAETLDAWINTPIHDDLLLELDEDSTIRSVPFWAWARVERPETESILPPASQNQKINWQRVDVIEAEGA